MLLAIFLIAVPISVSAYPNGAPRCMHRPGGPHSSPTTSKEYTFSVSEVRDRVVVELSTNQRFKGILITSNFSANSTGPDLSLGQWTGSGCNADLEDEGTLSYMDNKFRTLGGMRGNCGITHTNNNAKTGRHKFYFNPKGDGWKQNGFRAIIVVDTRTVHEFDIPAA